MSAPRLLLASLLALAEGNMQVAQFAVRHGKISLIVSTARFGRRQSLKAIEKAPMPPKYRSA